jgi:hypothetical protein
MTQRPVVSPAARPVTHNLVNVLQRHGRKFVDDRGLPQKGDLYR